MKAITKLISERLDFVKKPGKTWKTAIFNLEKPGKQQFGTWKNLEKNLEKPGIGPLVRSGNPGYFKNYAARNLDVQKVVLLCDRQFFFS